ncbi:MAG: hypothetical protein LBH40_00390 [Alphaproteobacteria bacterium]|jgi:hypothetical protein|nr:hypothetical protein [Alphaproteobacteria bacterium]
MIDTHNLISFLNNCTKYCFNDNKNLRGIDTKSFFDTLKNTKLENESIQSWKYDIYNTNTKQKQSLLKEIYIIYCDKNTNEFGRDNALNLMEECKDLITNDVLAILLQQHQEYKLSAKNEKVAASKNFFNQLGLNSSLPEADQISIFNKAITNLKTAHEEANNFYNEPPFAERLCELSQNSAIPQSLQPSFVETIILCAIGNGYGVSWDALPYYNEIIENFKPTEIHLLFTNLADNNSNIKRMIEHHPSCKRKLKDIINNIKEEKIPTKHKTVYRDFIK